MHHEEVAMEKLIARCSYWLGITCLVIAVIWKGVNILRYVQSPAGAGGPLGHSAFMHASILFLVATIGTACYTWLNSQKP
jgi:hypothetical protein